MLCHIGCIFVFLLHYYDFAGRIAVGFFGAVELQGAADGDIGAIDVGAVVEREDVGSGVVGEGIG